MNAHRLRRLLVLISVLAAIAIGYGQVAFDLGMTPEAFSAEGDSTVRVAKYTFSIWGVIYLYLLVYAVYQILPRTPETPLLNRLGWASLAAFVGIAAWVVAAAANAKWLTVILIFASGGVLAAALGFGRDMIAGAGRTTRMMAAWPLALLGGWLAIASIANLITVLTAKALLGPIPPFVWGVAGIALAAVLAVVLASWTRLWIYAVPILWGLVGIFNAEREDGNMPLALAALAAAFLAAMALALSIAAQRRNRMDSRKATINESDAPSQSLH